MRSPMLPFEVAKPERVILPLRKRGFVLDNLKTVGNGWGCNEYVFREVEASDAAQSFHGEESS